MEHRQGMDHDLKRFPRLMAKLLSGSPLPQSYSVQGFISVWTSAHLGALTAQEQEKLGWMVELIARSSAQAQGLRSPITSLQKLQKAGQTLYLATERTVADRVRLVGLLKTGRKSLFLRDSSNAYCTRQPLCVLDFFVLPQNQRQGVGQALFQVFQATEAETASSVAYDTPSPKLLGFLRKHYGLLDLRPQDNKFVVFPGFWDSHGSPHVVHVERLARSQWSSVASRALTPPRSRSGLTHLASRPATAASGQLGQVYL